LLKPTKLSILVILPTDKRLMDNSGTKEISGIENLDVQREP
jgi:hypothetical protein